MSCDVSRHECILLHASYLESIGFVMILKWWKYQTKTDPGQSYNWPEKGFSQGTRAYAKVITILSQNVQWFMIVNK